MAMREPDGVSDACAAVAVGYSAGMIRRFLLCAAALAWPALAQASASKCPAFYVGGQAPDFAKIEQAAPTRELCFKSFAVLHSGATRTPLWAAEHLTAEAIRKAAKLIRTNQYHAESKLAKRQRAENADYARSGYDRGHMAPHDDMPNAISQRQSFSLSNMVPQAPRLNRVLWRQIESTVRDVATTDGDAWVVTGPLFIGSNVQALRGRVLVPTHVWKAVYDPTRHGAAVYLTDNSNAAKCTIISVKQFQEFSGINPFPGLPAGTTRLPLTQPAACR